MSQPSNDGTVRPTKDIDFCGIMVSNDFNKNMSYSKIIDEITLFIEPLFKNSNVTWNRITKEWV